MCIRDRFFNRPELVFQPRTENPKTDEFVFSMTADENSPSRLPADVRKYEDYASNSVKILQTVNKVADNEQLLREGVSGELRYATIEGTRKNVVSLLDPVDASISGFKLIDLIDDN